MNKRSDLRSAQFSTCSLVKFHNKSCPAASPGLLILDSAVPTIITSIQFDQAQQLNKHMLISSITLWLYWIFGAFQIFQSYCSGNSSTPGPPREIRYTYGCK